jgi:hypothetical protein
MSTRAIGQIQPQVEALLWGTRQSYAAVIYSSSRLPSRSCEPCAKHPRSLTSTLRYIFKVTFEQVCLQKWHSASIGRLGSGMSLYIQTFYPFSEYQMMQAGKTMPLHLSLRFAWKDMSNNTSEYTPILTDSKLWVIWIISRAFFIIVYSVSALRKVYITCIQ